MGSQKKKKIKKLDTCGNDSPSAQLLRKKLCLLGVLFRISFLRHKKQHMTGTNNVDFNSEVEILFDL